MRRRGHGVSVKSQPEVEAPALKRLPRVGREPRYFILTDAKSGTRAEPNPLGGKSRRPDDAHWQKVQRPVIVAMREVGSNLELVGAEAPGPELISLLPFRAVGVALLPVEKSARRGLEQELVRTGAVRRQVDIKSFVAELRNEQ